MGLFRRRARATREPAGRGATTGTEIDITGDDGVPVPTPEALARTEHALVLLASQSAQLHTTVVRLENRVDVLSAAMLERLDAASTDELAEARMHTAKVAAEVSRLEVNLAARLDAIRDELRGLTQDAGGERGDSEIEIDLRLLHPTDTGWSRLGA